MGDDVSDRLLSDTYWTARGNWPEAYIVSDRLLSDMYWTSKEHFKMYKDVSDRLLSDKRKHPLTVLIGNEGMFFY